MSIPLIQKPDKDDINTSIIAIKRNIERINMLLGLSNSEEIDTSEFVKKSDIVDVVEAGNMNPVTSNAVVPVDEVTIDNMQSVTSNAVAKAISYSTDKHIVGYWTDGVTPVYEETFETSFSNTGNISFLLNTDLPSNINRVIFLNGMIYEGNSYAMPVPFTDVGATPTWFTYVNYGFTAKDIYFNCNLTSSIPYGANVQVIITIRYTTS